MEFAYWVVSTFDENSRKFILFFYRRDSETLWIKEESNDRGKVSESVSEPYRYFQRFLPRRKVKINRRIQLPRCQRLSSGWELWDFVRFLRTSNILTPKLASAYLHRGKFFECKDRLIVARDEIKNFHHPFWEAQVHLGLYSFCRWVSHLQRIFSDHQSGQRLWWHVEVKSLSNACNQNNYSPPKFWIGDFHTLILGSLQCRNESQLRIKGFYVVFNLKGTMEQAALYIDNAANTTTGCTNIYVVIRYLVQMSTFMARLRVKETETFVHLALEKIAGVKGYNKHIKLQYIPGWD